jgi:hypothetical protein
MRAMKIAGDGNFANGSPVVVVVWHSTITLTMDRYTHLRREDLAGALNPLPDLSSPRKAAILTGTDGPENRLSPDLSLDSEFRHISVESSEAKTDQVRSEESLGNTEENGGFLEQNVSIGLLAELADALDSKSNARKGVSVRLR